MRLFSCSKKYIDDRELFQACYFSQVHCCHDSRNIYQQTYEYNHVLELKTVKEKHGSLSISAYTNYTTSQLVKDKRVTKSEQAVESEDVLKFVHDKEFHHTLAWILWLIGKQYILFLTHLL